MNYKFNIQKDGKWVDMETLSEEERQEIKARLSQRIADHIAVCLARQEGARLDAKKST